MDEKSPTKGRIYYSMGEVAEMFDVNQSLIRFWESKFGILKPHKNRKGNRMFTPEDVETLKLIYHLVKEKGMTLAGAEKRIKENREGTRRDMEIADRLLKIRAILLEIRQELKDGNTDESAIFPENTDLFSLDAAREGSAMRNNGDLNAGGPDNGDLNTREKNSGDPESVDSQSVYTVDTDPEGGDRNSADTSSPGPRIIQQTLF